MKPELSWLTDPRVLEFYEGRDAQGAIKRSAPV